MQLNTKESTRDLDDANSLHLDPKDDVLQSSMRHATQDTLECRQSPIFDFPNDRGNHNSYLEKSIYLHQKQTSGFQSLQSGTLVESDPFPMSACLRMGEGISELYDSLGLDRLLEKPND